MTDRRKLLSSCASDEVSSNRISKGEYSSTVSTLVSQTPIAKNKKRWPLENLQLTPQIRRRLEILGLALAVTVVVGLFAIPFGYHIRQITSDTFYNDYHCITKSKPFNETCGELSWSEIPSPPPDDNSSSVVYRGEVCKAFLQKWQDCAAGRQGDVIVCPVQQQNKIEPLVAQLIKFVDAADSTVCQSAILPFVCQYAFPLCADNQYLPSREECYHVSTDACVKEWEFAENYLHMPSCELLPPQTYPTNGSDDIPIIEVLNSSNITCSHGFYEHDNFCLPSCYNFKQNSKHVSLVMKIIEIWTGWFGLIVAVMVLILSVVRYKSMFTLPSVFLVYMTISYSVPILFVVITFFDQSGLYCSSQDLIHSIENPTLFCTVSGAVFHYCLVNSTIWWFFHVCSIFYKLIFPFRAKRIEKYEKYIHVVQLAVGLLLPLPAVIYVLVRSKYIPVDFPPLLCIPKSGNLWYYSTILVLNVLTALGVCMFIPMFWVVHKHQGIFRVKNNRLPLTIAERKILFVLCYYAVFGVFSLTYFGTSTWDQDDFMAALLEYFECNLFGENTRCVPCFRNYFYTLFQGASYVSMSFIPVANLIFVVNWKKAGLLFDKLKATVCPSRAAYSIPMDNDHSALSPHPESTGVNNSDHTDYN